MDFLKKESASETIESFTQRVPLGQKSPQNMPFVSQIQELMAILVQKKSQLKEAKIKQSNLLGKEEQQQVRISKIKIGMEHEIEKQQMTRCQQDRLQDELSATKESIKELNKDIKALKGQLGEALEDIITQKKNKMELEGICAELDVLVREKTIQNQKIDEQNQNLETLIISTRNDVRSKQDELTHLQLQKTQLISLFDFLEQKVTLATRAKNSTHAQNNQVTQQVTKTEQKLQNIKKETNEIEWSCEQIRSQNTQIEDLNRRLLVDLEGVKKHLATMEKMNHLLQNSIAEYGMTGSKVTRMIHAAKSF